MKNDQESASAASSLRRAETLAARAEPILTAYDVMNVYLPILNSKQPDLTRDSVQLIRDLLAELTALRDQVASVTQERDTLRTALRTVTEQMDRAGDNGYGQFECPWCQCHEKQEPDGAWPHHPNCALLLASAAVLKGAS